VLSVEAAPLSYRFFYQQAYHSAKILGAATTRDLSSETIGGFTGVYVGMYATGNGRKSTRPADFDWFEYQAENHDTYFLSQVSFSQPRPQAAVTRAFSG